MTKLMLLCVLFSIVGCGGSGISGAGGGSSAVSSGAGATGGEGAASTVSVSASVSSSTGMDVDLTTVGDPECDFAWKTTAPIFGESVTDSVPPLPINEDGTLAMKRVTPPTYPWTAENVDYRLGIVPNICVVLDHEVVAWVGPAGQDPPVHPSGVVVTPVLAADVVNGGNIADASVTFASTLTIKQGEVLWVGVRLRALSATSRTCLRTCRGGGLDPDSYWTPVDQSTGLALQCPKDDCTLIPLSESPNKADAMANGNDDKRLVITVHGHP